MAPRAPRAACRLLPAASTALIAVAAAVALASPSAAAAEAPKVVASIKPVHSLAAGVMAGVGEPGLIIEGAASPHTYQMRPSEARMLSEADVVFFVGEALETFLGRPLEALAGRARVVALLAADGVEPLPYQESGALGARGAAHPADDDHDGEDEHDHGAGMDPHIWLDPDNARAMVDAIAAELGAADPANETAYRENAERLKARLDVLDAELRAMLEPVRDVPFVTFHDAFRYFASHYGLTDVGSITIGPERQPGAQRLREIREAIEALDVACVFSEPPFEPRLVATVTEGTDARTGVLDPEGVAQEPGPDAYVELMRANAEALVGCLSR